MTPILDRYRLTPGLPPDGAPGQFLAVEATGAMWLLRWSAHYGEWHALGFEGEGAENPARRRGGELPALLTGHIMGPAIGAAGPTTIPFGGVPPFPAGDVEGAAGEMSGTAAGDRHPVGVRALGHPDTLPADDEAAYPFARDAVIAAGNPTASFLQRRFQIGFNRASRFIERMEAEGLISAWSDTLKGRTLLVSSIIRETQS